MSKLLLKKKEKYIPYGRQSLCDEDIAAAIEVLKSDFITQGSKVPEFEQAVAHYTGSKYAVATNSGTSALHIACLALGLDKGDILWTSPISFVASANCALYCGASVDFVDIDPVTWNISVASLRSKLEHAAKTNKLPDILIPVHLCGLSCDMEEIYRLSKQYGFKIIEDACHALGGTYQASPIGDCRYSDATVFSFHPVKTITTGEGGMVVTNNQDCFTQMNRLRSHGITKNDQEMTKQPDGPWYYQQLDLGFNYRLTDIHAALGLSQLNRIDAFITQRHKIAARYDSLLNDIPVQRPHRSDDRVSGMHLYVIRLTEGKSAHKSVFETMRNNNIGVNLHYIPIHTQPYYRNLGFRDNDFPEAMRYYQEAISLPMFVDLTVEEQDKVVAILKDCIT